MLEKSTLLHQPVGCFAVRQSAPGVCAQTQRLLPSLTLKIAVQVFSLRQGCRLCQGIILAGLLIAVSAPVIAQEEPAEAQNETASPPQISKNLPHAEEEIQFRPLYTSEAPGSAEADQAEDKAPPPLQAPELATPSESSQHQGREDSLPSRDAEETEDPAPRLSEDSSEGSYDQASLDEDEQGEAEGEGEDEEQESAEIPRSTIRTRAASNVDNRADAPLTNTAESVAPLKTPVNDIASQQDSVRSSDADALAPSSAPSSASPSDTPGRSFDLGLDESFLAEGGELPPLAGELASASDRMLGPSKTSENLPEGLKPAAFRNVVPGVTTLAQLESLWGEPQSKTPSKTQGLWTYLIAPFEKVELTLRDSKVQSIQIHLGSPVKVQALEEQLGLKGISPVIVRDAKLAALGKVYPEKGVLFTFAPDKNVDLAAHVLLDPLDAQAFTLRAETLLERTYSERLADLAIARKLNSTFARTPWLEGVLLAELEQDESALRAVETALNLEPDHPDILLTYAELLLRSGMLQECEAALDPLLKGNTKTSALQRSHAWRMAGDLSAARTPFKREKSYEQHRRSLENAQVALEDGAPRDKEAALTAIINAHASIAEDIAAGQWRGKEAAVLQWLEKARKLAGEAEMDANRKQALRFHVACHAVYVLSLMKSDVDSAPWVKEAYRLARELGENTRDPERADRIKAELANMFFNAMRSYHGSTMGKALAGKENEKEQSRKERVALAHGERALDLLGALNSPNPLLADRFLEGRIDYHLGAILAVERNDIPRALPYFDRASQLLEDAERNGNRVSLVELGDAWVTMGAAYWRDQQKEKGIEFTSRGVKILERAVARNQTLSEAMRIPYQNLAAMHRKLGEFEDAERYTKLAALPVGNAKRMR